MTTATDLLRSSDGDLAIVAGDLAIADPMTALAQRIATRLRRARSEWFMDLRAGLPWFEVIRRKGTPTSVVASLVRAELRRTPGVARVDSVRVTVTTATRSATIDWAVTATSGATVTGTTT